MSALKHQEGGDHYAKLRIQPIEYIHGNQIGFAEGNVIKYVTRWRDKGGIADLKKARHFLDLLIELETRGGKVPALETENDHIPDDGKMIYSDEGYTEQDMRAASLVHDALDPALVEPCGYTTIHADDDGWHVHVGKGCPLDDQDTLIHIKVASGGHYDAMPAEYANFLLPIGHEERITHWRYAKENQLG
jgi:hypothetical protein